MNLPSLRRLLLAALAVLILPACATPTVYFSTSYVQLAKADHPGLLPAGGTPEFARIDDMTPKSHALHGEGFVMLGYSQFVSPLLPSLAQGQATTWATKVGAEQVVLETPKRGASNLHYYLVTYWARVRPEQFAFGGYVSDLPDELLERVGKDLNVVILEQTIAGTPAAAAGLRANDVILAVDGEPVPDVQAFSRALDDNHGKEVVLEVSRDARALEVPVQLAAGVPLPQAAKEQGVIGYRESPWFGTQPRDWSGFSMSALTASTVKAMQRQRELEFERTRAQAERTFASQSSRSVEDRGPGSRRGVAAQTSRRGVETQTSRRGVEAQTSRRGGGALQTGLRAPYVDEQRVRAQMKEMGRSWGAQMDRQRQQKVQIWLENYPNLYGGMFR
jgi:hypothetical protein